MDALESFFTSPILVVCRRRKTMPQQIRIQGVNREHRAMRVQTDLENIEDMSPVADNQYAGAVETVGHSFGGVA
jgi:hypothetical protein